MPKAQLPKITDCTDLAGRYVLLRSSLNVPIEDNRVTNQFRVTRALPTINYLLRQGARVIVIAHIGREPYETLQPVYELLKPLVPITFCAKSSGPEVRQAREALVDGSVLLLENVRQDPREKANDPNFAVDLAGLADLYVNDAFSDSHRSHASLVGIPKHLPSYFGINFMHEYEELSRVMQPTEPSLFILGGAKFATKMPLIEEYIEHYDHVFIGGALANDIFKAKGYEVGTSLVSDIDLTENPLLQSEKLLLPTDVTVKRGEEIRICSPEDVQKDEAILDAGPATLSQLSPLITKAKTILWNGPIGNYEGGFAKQSEELARLIAASSAYSVVGGGDTVAVVEMLGCQDKFSFLSTAGGAMLTYMEHGTLSAIDAVIDAHE